MVAILMVVLTLPGCMSSGPPPAPPVVTTEAPPAYPEPYRNCDEVVAAWNAGRIRADSLINGAVWIVDANGRTIVCQVPRHR